MKKYPFPNRNLVDCKEWCTLVDDVLDLDQWCYPNRDSRYNGFNNEVFQINPFYWGDCNCENIDIDGDEVGHEAECPVSRHNFIYKPTGFWIDWYKYPFRSSDMSEDLSKKEIKQIWKNCIKSVK